MSLDRLFAMRIDVALSVPCLFNEAKPSPAYLPSLLGIVNE